MVFNSITFLIFLAIVLLAYYRLPHRGQNILLLVASYVFYGWWDWRFLGLLLFSTFFDYWCALWIEGQQHRGKRRMFLAFSMAVNLGVLCIFKYYNFFAESLVHVLHAFGMQASFPTLHVVLPVGISFYTFLSMSYTIDVYRRELPATRQPLDYMLYVAFFPHLVAGPIVRASFLLPQCQRPRVMVPDEVANGIWLILLGYLKKVVIGDHLALIANWGFGSPLPPLHDANSWLLVYAFAFQIYADFSGYSDIARGLAKIMGFELTINFRAPYLVTNPSTFWQHWHISLSTWLRDYLYIPLGGNRHGRRRTYLNLMITMLLGGLWHGAGMAYLLWGLYHGTLLAAQRGWRDLTGHRERHVSAALSALHPPHRTLAQGIRHGLLVILFFHLTCLGWLLFRAGSAPLGVDQVALVHHYLLTMIRPPSEIHALLRPVLLLGGLCLFFQWRAESMDHFSTWSPRQKTWSVVLALTAIAGLGIFSGGQFIYFQF